MLSWKALSFPPVLFCLTLFNISIAAAQIQSCDPISTIPMNFQSGHTDPLQSSHGQYLVLQTSDSEVKLLRVEGEALQVVGSYSLVTDARSSFSFDQEYLYIALRKNVAVEADKFQTPEELKVIRRIQLSTGEEISPLIDDVSTNLSGTASFPFHTSPTSSYPYEDWRERYFTSPTFTSQIGRLVSASGGKTHSFNFVEYSQDFPLPPRCYTGINPDYPDEPQIEITRYPFICRPIPFLDQTGEPVVNCNCELVIPDGEVEPVEVCQMCFVPDYIQREDHWWRGLNPGARTLNTQGSVLGSFTLSGPLRLPAGLENFPYTSRDVRINGLETTVADGQSRKLLLGADADIAESELTDMGGVFIFQESGAALGFYTLGVKNAEFGKSIAKLGQPADVGSGTQGHFFAVGGPGIGEIVPESGVELPPGSESFFRPHTGTVAAFELLDSGELYTSILLFGDNTGDAFGASIVGLGDNNEDGAPELLVGAPEGRYARIHSADIPIPLVELRRNESGFGKFVGALSLPQSSLPSFAIVGSDSYLHMYRLSDCVAYMDGSSGPDEDQTALFALLNQILDQLNALIEEPRPRRVSPRALRSVSGSTTELAVQLGQYEGAIISIEGVRVQFPTVTEVDSEATKIRRYANRVQRRRARCRSQDAGEPRRQCNRRFRNFIERRVKPGLLDSVQVLSPQTVS